jgi:hypothetical protein
MLPSTPMLSMDKYPQEYVDECRANIDAGVAAYEHLAATAKAQQDAALDAALESFEPFFYNNMVVVLEGYFVNRQRAVERKDGNPLNEVRVLCNSIMQSGSTLAPDTTITLNPEKSVLKLEIGDDIRLSGEDFARLSKAFFAELERKYL